MNFIETMDDRHAARLAAVLDCAENGDGIAVADLRFLMSLDTPGALDAMFAAARRLRRRHFGDAVFLYGFLYVSTHCRNACTFCLYRRGNPEAPRYRKRREEIVAAASGLAASGVHLVDLTLGEDPLLYDGGFDSLHDTLDDVMAAAGLPVMVSAGVVPPDALERFARQGVSWFACYQETHSRDLYARLRTGQDYDLRMQSKCRARELGMRIEEGLLVGVGETAADLVHSIDTMRRMDADQVRAMTFVPQKGTPMAAMPPPDPMREVKLIALMRLSMPERLIPASLDIDGLAGLARRLDAGANVVTSLVPPGRGLAGVARSDLDIDAGGRSVAGIRPVLAACGLAPATPSQYRRWIERRRQIIMARKGTAA